MKEKMANIACNIDLYKTYSFGYFFVCFYPDLAREISMSVGIILLKKAVEVEGMATIKNRAIKDLFLISKFFTRS